MNKSKESNWLLFLIIINVLVSIGHYVHNIIFLPQYHEAMWVTPILIDSFWFVMTPFSCIGYVMYCKGNFSRAYFSLYTYCFFSLFVLGHYLVTPIQTLSVTINIVILSEAIAAVALALYTLRIQTTQAY
jgi:hypothetical protein